MLEDNKQWDELGIEEITIQRHAAAALKRYLREKNVRHIVLVTDRTLQDVACRELATTLSSAGFSVEACIVKGNELNDVVADEAAIVQVLLQCPANTEILIAVGSGTIHDITRFSSYKMKLPFLSYPTAPSVDGFNSKGAPLVIRGEKITFPAQAPLALFADTELLTRAPKAMIAAGFGDILGKYTSLADWRFGHLFAQEAYHEQAAAMTEVALKSCIEHIDELAEAKERGVKMLMEALVLSGLAMLVTGNSYPASGAEHHLSHYWEMNFLRQKKRQILHGAKVGVSTQIIASLYKQEVAKLLNESDSPDIVTHLHEIQHIIAGIPSPERLKKWMARIGGPTSIAELGVSEELLDESLAHAHTLRDRYTMLRFRNEFVHRNHTVADNLKSKSTR